MLLVVALVAVVEAMVDLHAEHLLSRTADGCVVLYAPDNRVLERLDERLGDRVQFVALDTASFTSLLVVDHPYVAIKVVNETAWRYRAATVTSSTWAIAPRHPVDRTCLLRPAHSSVPLVLLDVDDADDALDLINEQCHSFLTPDGGMTDDGRRRDALLDERFGLAESLDPVGRHPPLECEYVDEMPTSDEFFERYLSASRPVVVRSAVRRRWAAMDKWSNEWLRAQFGNRTVHVKLTPPAGVFEGVESLSLWPSSTMPAEVRRQLVRDDVVLVRPAGVSVTFNELVDLVEKRHANASFVSAYLEYTSMSDFLVVLREDAPAVAMIDELLVEEHRNVWLSDGRTLGKLHYDAFDNLLVMVDGRKTLRLYSPWHNRRLYEGHLVEAQLVYANGTFERRRLMESTAMTMTPVDILGDTSDFPLFEEAPTSECTIEAGDALYLPAFWWHEVQSAPSTDKRNLAVNFWYTPFFNKEFPCAECPFDVNPVYRHLLHRSKHKFKSKL